VKSLERAVRQGRSGRGKRHNFGAGPFGNAVTRRQPERGDRKEDTGDPDSKPQQEEKKRSHWGRKKNREGGNVGAVRKLKKKTSGRHTKGHLKTAKTTQMKERKQQEEPRCKVENHQQKKTKEEE